MNWISESSLHGTWFMGGPVNMLLSFLTLSLVMHHVMPWVPLGFVWPV